MRWNQWIRQTHRWMSVIFTLAVIVNGVAVVRGRYSTRLGLMAVGTLALMFLSGAWLFVLPYAAKWRNRRRAA
jgi:heme A synthase